MNKFWRIILYLIGGFFILFSFRLFYSYQVNDPVQNFSNFVGALSSEYVSRNYASVRKKMPGLSADVTGQQTAIDQKYEKIASVSATSHDFEEDVQWVKSKIEAYTGVIQYEKNEGNEGSRRLWLTIGIQPTKFDSFYQTIQEIGKIMGKTITKTDKTNEYLNLNAQKRTKEQIKENLEALKDRGGNIAEFIELENRLLQIEEELQGLGVQLGNFDVENEFCTVQYQLQERQSIKQPFMQRLISVLEWTLQTYLMLVFLGVLMALFAFLLLGVINQFDLVKKTFRSMSNPS